MCGVNFRSIQLLSVKWVLVPCVQFVGDLKMDMSGLLLSRYTPWQMRDTGFLKQCVRVKTVKVVF